MHGPTYKPIVLRPLTAPQPSRTSMRPHERHRMPDRRPPAGNAKTVMRRRLAGRPPGLAESSQAGHKSPNPSGCPSPRPHPSRPHGFSPRRPATRPALLLSAMKFSAPAFSATLFALASGVTAQLTILSPGGPDLWWVAQSDNDITWTCKTSPYTNFTVLIANSDPTVLVQPQAFIAQQNNFDCSELITKDRVNMPPATGYTIQLADPFNETNVSPPPKLLFFLSV
ncbi:hypothetical protein BD309DRAFT_542025 [Dichomitus squalens]|nr:hypothetical protein BD309DRAFT_542025 [Dichomitus squalens]